MNLDDTIRINEDRLRSPTIIAVAVMPKRGNRNVPANNAPKKAPVWSAASIIPADNPVISSPAENMVTEIGNSMPVRNPHNITIAKNINFIKICDSITLK